MNDNDDTIGSPLDTCDVGTLHIATTEALRRQFGNRPTSTFVLVTVEDESNVRVTGEARIGRKTLCNILKAARAAVREG